MEAVCVIGAGGSGLAAAQALGARDLPYTVFEAGSDLGGNWRYDNDSGHGSAYASLRTNTSRLRTSYRSFRMPLRGPQFPGHTEMLAYIEAFAERFGLRDHIRFRSSVTSARPLEDGSWEVQAGDGAPERFGAVMVATGYNSVPLYPDLPGHFDGLQMHSHEYRVPDPFAGRDTVVIGLGCSAGELATEISDVARSVTLVTRSGSWILARYVGRIPADWVDTRSGSRMPWSMRRKTIGRMIAGPDGLTKVGLPAPSVRVGDKPFVIADGLFRAVRRERIRVTGPVAELAGDRVRLADGSEVHADAILYGTGYRAEFPFLAPEVEAPTLERARLYRGVAHPGAPGLFFIGLVGGHGALIPMFEAQANWTAEVLAGRLALPSEEVMRESIARDDEVRRRDFDPRWGILWDRFPYIRSLDAESRRARRRPGPPRRAEAATVS